MINNKSFTLIEVFIAMFLLTVGTVGAIYAIVRVIEVTEVSSSQLIASYLAQEGIEIVRNIRDGNWLEGSVWDTGLTGCEPTGAGCQADYTNTQSLVSFTGDPLNIDGGFYSYLTGTPTIFQRKITIEEAPGDILEVTVWVGWTERGKSYSVTAQANLYKWLGQ